MTDPAAAPAEELPARFTYVGRPDSPVMLRVRRHDRAARTSRAVRAWLACWGLAIVSVLVPVLHFLLVPGFLIAGPLLAAQRWSERFTVLGARGVCPGCGAGQDIALSLAPTPRMPLRCEACGRQVILEPGPETLSRED